MTDFDDIPPVEESGEDAFGFEPPPMQEAEAMEFRKGGRDCFAWLQSHRRADAPAGAPMRGFSRSGVFTLWLPAGELQSRVVFKDGKATQEIVPNFMSSEAMIALRMQTLDALGDDNGRPRFHLALVEYAVMLIKTSYNVTDDDLAMLLDGTHWHAEVIRHLLGGADQISRLLRGRVAEVTQIPKVVYVPVAAKPKARWWQKWKR